MAAAAATPVPTKDPDPSRTDANTPTRIGRLLGVLRRLIDYGKQLATTVRQRAASPDFHLLARPFGTADLAVILARISAGLRRAAALESRLCACAARGRDLTPAPARPPALRGPCPARPAAPHPAAVEAPRLAPLPPAEEIAAAVRRRPVGAVIVDICRDLGITPGNCDRGVWDELAHAIITYGGSLAGFFDTLCRRLSAFGSADGTTGADAAWPTALPRLPALATGPP